MHYPTPLNDKRMNATVSLESIWNLIQSLSPDNQKWLADHKELVFPHIPANRELSPEVRNMVEDRLPVDIDIERETEKMWEEWAK